MRLVLKRVHLAQPASTAQKLVRQLRQLAKCVRKEPSKNPRHPDLVLCVQLASTLTSLEPFRFLPANLVVRMHLQWLGVVTLQTANAIVATLG